MYVARPLSVLVLLLLVWPVAGIAGPRAKDSTAFAKLHIPHLEKRPTIEDFESMQPSPSVAGSMLKVDGFLQRDPKDGSPISQKTEVYLGYTNENLYVVCLCFDSEPNKIRAHMVRREQINDDDQFGFVLDTFSDRKTGVFFYANPYGVQQDGIWNDFSEPDYSYDMLWNSQGRITPQGFVLWFEIPFRSLRFPRTAEQDWGIFFERDIRRNFEFSFYPRITSNAQGFLTQETKMDGMRDISPGRNMQFIPYGLLASDHFLNQPVLTAAGPPPAYQDAFEHRAGLDAKFVAKDSLTFDVTLNPDFSQVETAVTDINFNYNEKFRSDNRPFFQEGSAYFGNRTDY